MGPRITFTGKLLREPQSSERPRPSAAPVLFGLVLLALALMLPVLISSLGYIVIGLVVLLLVARKLPMGWGRGARREGQERPRILVTKFRVGIPGPDGPRTMARMFSCRLLTRQVDGTVELASGDTVTVAGWRGGGELVHVQSITVESTRSRLKAASGASAVPVAVATLLLLTLAGGVVWVNRVWLSPDVLAQAVGVLEQSVVSLLTLVVIIAITWFVVRKVILRR